jgi:ABC-type Mn2+/Zn2+ transport system permease subunit
MTNKQQLITWITHTLREAAWAPLSVFGFYLLGLSFGLYKLFPPSDIPTHFMGGVAITYFYRAAIRNGQKFVGDIPLPIQILFAFTCTGTTTIFWEFYENIFDFLFGTDMVRGLQDTIVDLSLGLLGALVLSLFYRSRR